MAWVRPKSDFLLQIQEEKIQKNKMGFQPP